ncbi:MAG: hypothetical protein ACRC1K_03920 [Planctomycetia bacterium]
MPDLSISQEVKSLVDAEVARGGYSDAGALLRDVLVRRRNDAVRAETAARLRELLDLAKPEQREMLCTAIRDRHPGVTFTALYDGFDLSGVPDDRMEPLWERVDILVELLRSERDVEEGRVYTVAEARAEVERRLATPRS